VGGFRSITLPARPATPKGVVYHHRGAYLNALGNILVWGMRHHPVYLWTLPVFHCNGWCFPSIIGSNGPLSNPTPAVQPDRGERVFMPHSRRSVLRESGVEWQAIR
jgi:acyl-CoA synthetase (AMP-forming)/AMP-acid ligase II